MVVSLGRNLSACARGALQKRNDRAALFLGKRLSALQFTKATGKSHRAYELLRYDAMEADALRGHDRDGRDARNFTEAGILKKGCQYIHMNFIFKGRIGKLCASYLAVTVGAGNAPGVPLCGDGACRLAGFDHSDA